MDSQPPSGPPPPRPDAPAGDRRPGDAALPPSAGTRSRRRRRKRRSDRAPRLHAAADRLTGALLYFLVIFTPWAFGTTQDWALWIAHTAGLGLGALLVFKWVIRFREAYTPPCWGDPPAGKTDPEGWESSPRRDLLTPVLGAVTFLILAYVAAGAVNARADYDETRRQFDYLREPLSWLPRSYDRDATWAAFLQYLGLAGVFWAARDWLRQRTLDDPKSSDDALPGDPRGSVLLPDRLRRLLWVLCLNGAALAIVSILQRADGTNKLLWIVESRSNKPADSVFGPWSYRANAAQYFNLLWPVCLAFWLWTQEQATRAVQSRIKRFDGPQLLLLPCALFMAACPTVCGSRGGALISIATGGLAAVLLLFARQLSLHVRWVTLLGLAVAGVASVLGGWNAALARFSQADAVYRTGIIAGTNEFTLLARVRMPDKPPGNWRTLVSLTSDYRAAATSRRAHLLIPPNGGFMAQIVGSALSNRNDLIARNLPADLAGRDVTLAIVRRQGLRMYLDGRPLATVENLAGHAPGWDGRVSSEYLKVGHSAVQEVALLGFALTTNELAAATGRPLTELSERLLAGKVGSTDLADATNAIVLPEGVAGQVAARPIDPATPWLTLTRTGAAGGLGFLRPVDALGVPFRGPIHVAFTVWNPANDPVYLAVSLDQGPASVVEVPARGEHRVQTLVTPPGGGTARGLQIALAEDDTGDLAAAEPGTKLFLRDLRADAGASVFARNVASGVRLDPAALTDRMSGRPEIYENARRMAADFGFWGSGAGTFASQYQLYRQPGQVWAAYAHDDWLETRITLGWPGLGLVVAGLAALFLRSLLGPGLGTLRPVLVLWWLALAGCLLHAGFDFPFRIHSVFLLFTLLAAMLTVLTVSRRT